MGQHHLDPTVDKAFIRLLDDLCMFERATSRGGLLLYIPEYKDEPIVISQGGKPQRICEFSAFLMTEERQTIETIFVAAMNRRYSRISDV